MPHLELVCVLSVWPHGLGRGPHDWAMWVWPVGAQRETLDSEATFLCPSYFFTGALGTASCLSGSSPTPCSPGEDIKRYPS